MADIARAAGISKALLYHYFASKQEFFEATLRQAAEELSARIEPDSSRPPFEQLSSSLDGYLLWIEENAAAYTKLIGSATSAAEVRQLIDDVRERTAARILGGLLVDGAHTPAARAAVHGWLWFIDGACLEWLSTGKPKRDQLLGLLLGTLLGALTAAGAMPEAPTPADA